MLAAALLCLPARADSKFTQFAGVTQNVGEAATTYIWETGSESDYWFSTEEATYEAENKAVSFTLVSSSAASSGNQVTPAEETGLTQLTLTSSFTLPNSLNEVVVMGDISKFNVALYAIDGSGAWVEVPNVTKFLSDDDSYIISSNDAVALGDRLRLVFTLDESWQLESATAQIRSIEVKTYKPYPLWVAGVQVTDENMADVLPDYPELVSFDGDHTLTLNGIYIEESYEPGSGIYPVKSGLDTLVIRLLGENNLYSVDSCIVAANERARQTLVFSTDESNPGSLYLYATRGDNWELTGEMPIRGFSQVLYNNGLEARGVFNEEGDDMPEAYSIRIFPTEYDLYVNDVQVTSENMSNILGDNRATMRFDGEKTLVLDGVHLEGYDDQTITTGIDSLRVYLVGDNTLQGLASVFYSSDQTHMLRLFVTTAANTPGTLTLVNAAQSYFNGFNVIYEYGLHAVQGEDDSADSLFISAAFTPIVVDNEGKETLEFTSEDFVDSETGDPLDLSNTQIDNVLYTIDTADDADNGYDDGLDDDDTPLDDPGIVLNTEMTDADLEQAAALTPGTDDFANAFSGMTVPMSAGKGTVYVDARTDQEHQLMVKVGSAAPRSLNSTERDVLYVDYESAEPFNVYIYNGGRISTAAPGKHYRDKKTAISVKVYGVGVQSSAVIQTNSAAMTEAKTDVVKVFALDAANFSADGAGIILNTVCGKPVTELSSGVFDGVESDDVDYVDMSGSAVSDFTVNRVSPAKRHRGAAAVASLFDRFRTDAFIYLPAGNKAGKEEVNVVIDGECSTLQLAEDKEYRAPVAFTAQRVDYNRLFTPGVTSTVFLPFTIPAAQAAELGTFHTFKQIEGSTAVFNEAETGDILANTPYIFVPATGVTSIAPLGVEVEAAPENGTLQQGVMIGTYRPIAWDTDQSDIYGFAGESKDGIEPGRFVRVNAGASIAPYRAYLQIAASAKTLTLAFGDIATRIDGTTAAGSEAAAAQRPVYNMAGQRVAEPRGKGIYVVGGKKVVVK